MESQLSEKKQSDGEVSVKKPSKKMRDKRLNIRFTDAEFAVIEAKADGMNLARYARAILIKGSVPRRERDFPTINPKLLHQIHAMGKNLNQLTRYTHRQANANRPIDRLNLALAIDNMAEQLAQLKKQYQVQESYLNLTEDEHQNEEYNSSMVTKNTSSPVNDKSISR